VNGYQPAELNNFWPLGSQVVYVLDKIFSLKVSLSREGWSILVIGYWWLTARALYKKGAIIGPNNCSYCVIITCYDIPSYTSNRRISYL
jgi:hypothetical protein